MTYCISMLYDVAIGAYGMTLFSLVPSLKRPNMFQSNADRSHLNTLACITPAITSYRVNSDLRSSLVGDITAPAPCHEDYLEYAARTRSNIYISPA